MIVRACTFSFLLPSPLKDVQSLDKYEIFDTVLRLVKRNQDLPPRTLTFSICTLERAHKKRESPLHRDTLRGRHFA